MTLMLASVNSLDEALLVLSENVDIIDLKNPVSGALGALEIDVAKEIIAAVDGRLPISATIGDLPMHSEIIINAVKKIRETGVDYIKIGFFPSEGQVQVIEELADLTSQVKLIGVLFADTNPDFSLIDSLASVGFQGIMLDTLDKTRGSLTRIMLQPEIKQFISQVKSKGLMCGLAGSLLKEDVPVLLPYEPDYLGFRGALCDKNNRVGRINALSVRAIKQTLYSPA